MLPVSQVDGKPVGNGTVGPVTRQLVKTYWEWHADPRYSRPVRY